MNKKIFTILFSAAVFFSAAAGVGAVSAVEGDEDIAITAETSVIASYAADSELEAQTDTSSDVISAAPATVTANPDTGLYIAVIPAVGAFVVLVVLGVLKKFGKGKKK